MRTYTADEVDEMIGRALAREREKQAEQARPVAYEMGDELWWHDSPDINDYIRENGIPLYRHSPHSQPWVGLTPEERDYIWNTVGNSDAHGDVDGWSGRDVMKAIEAKLKEKNT